MFVADTYEPLPTCSPASPCTGSVAAWPIKADDSLDRKNPFANADLGTNYWPLIVPANPSDIVLPVGIAATASDIYVAAYDTTANIGYVFGFAVGSNSLTPLNGGEPIPAGVHPSAITADPAGSHLYVTDQARNNVHAFAVSGGTLTPIAGGPFATGNAPSAIVVDKTGTLAYVANAQDSTITGYFVSPNGALAIAETSPSDTQPVALGIDPAMNQYLFTANFLANTVSGYRIDTRSGELLNSQFSPYAANANPTAVAAVPHGSVQK